jgi:hypothetical protein
MIRAFLVIGTLVLSAFAYGTYSGASFTQYEEVKDVPKSIRNNPGVYRSVYSRVPHKSGRCLLITTPNPLLFQEGGGWGW